jgi:hypothetical protein
LIKKVRKGLNAVHWLLIIYNGSTGENMKKKILIFCITVIVLLASCGTTSNVFDEMLSLEESAVLAIHPAFTIRSYNDIPVNLKTGGGLTGFTIPAGTTTLLFDVDTGRMFGNLRFLGRNFLLTYDFKAGNEYQILMLFVDRDGNYKATNIGESYLALFICQDNNFREPLFVLRFS